MTLERLNVHVYKEMLLWAIGKMTIITLSKPVKDIYGLGFTILFMFYFIFSLSSEHHCDNSSAEVRRHL